MTHQEEKIKLEGQEEKLEYNKPELKEHGDVEDVTLQGFFGTFSP